MFELLRKEYEVEILGQTLKYNQATVYECIDFSYTIQQEWFKLEDWIYEFLNDKIKLQKTDLLKVDLSKFIDMLYSSLFKWFFVKSTSSGKSIPYASYVVFLSEKLHIDPNNILNTYTPEQLSFYTDWIIYNINEQTKEWRNKNKINQDIKNTSQSDKDKILENIRLRDEKLKVK